MTALLNDDTPMLGATDLPSEMTQLDPSAAQLLSCSAWEQGCSRRLCALT